MQEFSGCSYLDLDSLLSPNDALPAEDDSNHVGLALLPVERLGGEQQPRLAQHELVPSFVVGNQVLRHRSFPLVFVQGAEIGNKSPWLNESQ